MDLEDFDNADKPPIVQASKSFTAVKALNYLDGNWYRRVGRRARWMDLIGDYAGNEPFIIDGESLFQNILDDPLLALGRTDSTDFQILHALHTLENILNDFLTCSAVFEVIFWEDLHHSTVSTGQAPDVVAARIFARRILFSHLRTLQIPVFTFKGPIDPAWLRHQKTTQPMFIMLNDGGILSHNSDFAPERVLIQRYFCFKMLSGGLAISLLKGAEFRDSKILSFVYEQNSSHVEVEAMCAAPLVAAVTAAREVLEEREAQICCGTKRLPLCAAIVMDGNLEQWLLAYLKTLHTAPSFSQINLGVLFLFIVHILVLDTIPAEERARPNEALDLRLRSQMSKSLPLMFLAAEHVTASTRFVPQVDGRVWTSLIRCIIIHYAGGHKDIEQVIGANTYQRAFAIWSTSLLPSPIPDLLNFSKCYPLPESSPDNIIAQTKPLTLCSFSNELFNTELSSISVVTGSEDDDKLEFSSTRSHFQFGEGLAPPDTRHWHSNNKAILPRHLGGEDQKPLTEWQRRRMLRNEQRFMSTLQRHAGTLTGASGGVLQRTVIPAVGSKGKSHTKEHHTSEKLPQSSMSGKTKSKNISSKQQLLNKIGAEKEAASQKNLSEFWLEQIAALSKMSDFAQMDHFERIKGNKKLSEPFLSTEVHLYALHIQLKLWIDDIARESDSVRDRYTVAIMRLVKTITEKKNVTPTVSKILSSILIALGFADHIPTMVSPNIPDRPIHFNFVKLLKSKPPNSPYHKFMRINEHPVIWQLRLFGEYMDRSMDSQPDRRVKFEPDQWQRKVLDAIDADSSLLVVAPTSAGKTFISFYAMEKVLRESDDGILVYVAPTKALVTQIAAEVYARFSKDLNGRSCWAIHTRDHHMHDPQKCQILVTVPEMLSIMLLSPPMARVWTPRIKRVILDEIHSIGQQEGGAVWEHIILLALCPIIGLSATIGAPEKFNEWLGSVQAAHGHKHVYINYEHRYSHLRKFFYNLQKNAQAPFSGLDNYKSSGRTHFLHPIAMLSFGARALPADIALEAPDTLTLYQALLTHKDSIPGGIDSLAPTTFFQEPSLLRQKDIIRYETALKKVVLDLTMMHDPRDTNAPVYSVIRSLEDPALTQSLAQDTGTAPTISCFRSNLIYLLSDLHVCGQLPAILFNFDRNACEIMVQQTLEDLLTAEENWRRNSPAWKKKLEQFEVWQNASKERQRQAERAKKRGDDRDDPSAAQPVSWESTFDPEDPSPQFSFAGVRSGYTKSELEEDLRNLAWSSTPDWAVNALRRGIAVHHSGMNKGYRSLVESLFRLKFITVVFATGTLALGINAPSKTVVFCGDSPFLTALMFRQCAGRAGRRGYDLLGHVIFYGLPIDRVQRLILSKLPSLGGNFPLTSTLCLRLFKLLEGSGYAPVAKEAIRSIMKLPHISFGSETGCDQLLHHLRFSIDYLRRARLLDRHGRPMNLSAVAERLYYTEPSNFAMVMLLRRGVLHTISSKQTSSIDSKRNFISLMAHLFGRRPLPKIYTTDESLREISRRSSSMVLLPPLPQDAREVLLEHDCDILRVFTSYALTFASQHADDLGRDNRLPLSGLDFPGQSTDSDSVFRKHLRSTAIRVTARSTFVANSGHLDNFGSIQELSRTVRRGLHLNAHAIPSMTHLTALPIENDAVYGLNAYLLDFYIHGQVAALVSANGIRRGDVWYALQDFVLSLKTVRVAVLELLKQSLDLEADATTPADSDEEGDGERGLSERPPGVSDDNWRVYEMIDEATNEFDDKFRAMWA